MKRILFGIALMLFSYIFSSFLTTRLTLFVALVKLGEWVLLIPSILAVLGLIIAICGLYQKDK